MNFDHPLLSRDEELELAAQLRGPNNKDARERLALHNIRLVRMIAASYFRSALGKSIGLEELEASGMVGLIKAINKFDHSKDIRFSTYATYWIRNEILRRIKQSSLLKVSFCSVDLSFKFRMERSRMERNGECATFDAVADRLGVKKRKRKTLMAALEATGGFTSLTVGECDLLEAGVASSYGTIPDLDVPAGNLDDVGKAVVYGFLESLDQRDRTVMELLYGTVGEPLVLRDVAGLFGFCTEWVRTVKKRSVKRFLETARAIEG